MPDAAVAALVAAAAGGRVLELGVGTGPLAITIATRTHAPILATQQYICLQYQSHRERVQQQPLHSAE